VLLTLRLVSHVPRVRWRDVAQTSFFTLCECSRPWILLIHIRNELLSCWQLISLFEHTENVWSLSQHRSLHSQLHWTRRRIMYIETALLVHVVNQRYDNTDKESCCCHIDIECALLYLCNAMCVCVSQCTTQRRTNDIKTHSVLACCSNQSCARARSWNIVWESFVRTAFTKVNLSNSLFTFRSVAATKTFPHVIRWAEQLLATNCPLPRCFVTSFYFDVYRHHSEIFQLMWLIGHGIAAHSRACCFLCLKKK